MSGAPITWRPVDDGARAGRSVLLRCGGQMALGRWDGRAWVYPATSGMELGFEPTSYYDPREASQGVFSGR